MKITKSKFVDLMTNNNNVFCGTTYRPYKKDELEYCLSDALKGFYPFINYRSCKAAATYLQFSDGSRLILNSDEFMKREYHEFDFPAAYVLAAIEKTFNEKENKEYYICMYYLIYKENAA